MSESFSSLIVKLAMPGSVALSSFAAFKLQGDNLQPAAPSSVGFRLCTEQRSKTNSTPWHLESANFHSPPIQVVEAALPQLFRSARNSFAGPLAAESCHGPGPGTHAASCQQRRALQPCQGCTSPRCGAGCCQWAPVAQRQALAASGAARQRLPAGSALRSVAPWAEPAFQLFGIV